MIQLPLEYLSDEALDILQMMAQEQRAALNKQIEMIIGEKVRRGGALNQMNGWSPAQ